MRRSINKLALFVVTSLATCGFVPIRASEPRIGLDESNTVTFLWDGTTPKEITARTGYSGTSLESLSEKEAFRQILQDAATRWSTVPDAKLRVRVSEEAAEPLPDDLRHVLSVKENNDQGGAALPITGDSIGKGLTSRDIADCDIALDGGPYEATSLAYVVTHELGHCLGLGHAHTNQHAIMGYTRTRQSASLGADDMAGIIYLYPSDELSMQNKEIVGSCGVIAGSQRGLTNFTGLFLLIFVVFLVQMAPRYLGKNESWCDVRRDMR